jgi:hypothetical protein
MKENLITAIRFLRQNGNQLLQVKFAYILNSNQKPGTTQQTKINADYMFTSPTPHLVESAFKIEPDLFCQLNESRPKSSQNFK